MTPPSDSTDKVRNDSGACCAHIIVTYVHEHNKDGTTRGWWQCCDCGQEFYAAGPHHGPVKSHLHEKLSALQARYDALEKSRGEFIKRSADYAAELAALRKSVQHAFTRFAYHELKRAATGEGRADE